MSHPVRKLSAGWLRKTCQAESNILNGHCILTEGRSIAVETVDDLDAKVRPASSSWHDLTWDELRAWASGKTLERGRSYFRGGHVKKLAVTDDGELVAWVQGNERYAVRVALGPANQSPRLSSLCTCPVGYACKHAVAAVIAWLDALANGQAIPLADADDLSRMSLDEGSSDELEDEADDEVDLERSSPRAPSNRQKTLASVQSYLAAQTHDQLAALIVELAGEFPDLRRELRERALLMQAPREQLLKAARQELRDVTSQEVWWHHWDREGSLPDYSRLQRLLSRLLEGGYANYLLELGVSLLREGTAQVQNAEDDGQTAAAITGCLEIVFQALRQSDLSNPEKLLFAIYAQLIDEYELAEGASRLLSSDWPRSDWSAVADTLLERLETRSSGKQAQTDWNRRALAECAADALQAAGRSEELERFLEAEAKRSGDYQRWIEFLIDVHRFHEAERTAREALLRMPEESRGWDRTHLDQLQRIATLREDWPTVAAHTAEAFFDVPSVESFQELVASSERAGCGSAVHSVALGFLETGERTQAAGRTRSRNQENAWPLPHLDYWQPTSGRAEAKAAKRANARPRFDLLLEIAIAERRADDVLDIYDQHFAGQRRTAADLGWFPRADHYASAVAACIAEKHPGPAAEIYQRLIQNAATQTGDLAYQTVVFNLRLLRPILIRLGRERQWLDLVATIRSQQRRKRNLLQMLDTLDDRPIVEELRR